MAAATLSVLLPPTEETRASRRSCSGLRKQGVRTTAEPSAPPGTPAREAETGSATPPNPAVSRIALCPQEYLLRRTRPPGSREEASDLSPPDARRNRTRHARRAFESNGSVQPRSSQQIPAKEEP